MAMGRLSREARLALRRGADICTNQTNLEYLRFVSSAAHHRLSSSLLEAPPDPKLGLLATAFPWPPCVSLGSPHDRENACTSFKHFCVSPSFLSRHSCRLLRLKTLSLKASSYIHMLVWIREERFVKKTEREHTNRSP